MSFWAGKSSFPKLRGIHSGIKRMQKLCFNRNLENIIFYIHFSDYRNCMVL